MDKIEVRTFKKNDWKLYKSLRLASLIESPDSFGSTLARETDFSDQEWESRLSALSEPAKILPLVGFIQDCPVGLAWGVLHGAEAREAHIYQMWVSPDSRGKGLGKALLARIVTWANSLQLSSLVLAVTTTNTEAITLYSSFGFLPLGETEPLRDGSELVVQPMQLQICL